jgi:hypothetical protein
MTPQVLSQLPPGAPWWMFALAVAGLALHIGGGSVAILAGWGAVLTRKGGPRHIFLGKAFGIAMLTMAGAAFALAVYDGQRENVAASLFATYLVATGWRAARRRDGTPNAFDYAATAAVAATGLMFLYWGLGAKTADFAAPDFVFAGLAALFVGIDIAAVRRGGVAGAQRVARHLWRMCAAFLFASFSFFLGQQKVMPQAWHGAAALWVLGLAPLGFLVFWMIRVRARPRAPVQA